MTAVASVNLTTSSDFTPQPHFTYSGSGFFGLGSSSSSNLAPTSQARHHHHHHLHHHHANAHNTTATHALSTEASVNDMGLSSDNFPFYDYRNMDAFPYPGDPTHLTKPWVREPNFFPLVAVYSVTFVLGIIGNALVISVLCCRRTGRCVTFPCLLSMAWADVIFLLVCVPHEILSHVILHWEVATIFCKLSNFVEMMSALAAIFNLILISVERYFVIAHPLLSKSLCTTRNSKIALVFTWVAAVVFAAPALVVMGTETNVYYSSFDNSSRVSVVLCGDFGLGGGDRNQTGRLAYAYWQLVLLFVLPALILFFCYIRVIYILWVSTRQLQNMTGSSRFHSSSSVTRNGHREPSSGGWKQVRGGSAERSLLSTATSSNSTRAPGEDALQARKQVIKMLIVIIVVFLICWGPQLILNTMKRMSHIDIYHHGAYHATVMFGCLPYVQSVVNPIIYVLMSKKIRDSICSVPCVRAILTCCTRRHAKHSPTHELLATNHDSVAVTGMKTSLETMRSYGASELTDV